MGRAARWPVVVLVVAGLVGCGGDPPALGAPPAGAQWLEHPVAVVAVPEDWVPVEEGLVSHLLVDDSDAVQYADSVAPEGEATGVTMWRWRYQDAPVTSPPSQLIAPLYGEGLKVHREERIDDEVAGAEEAFIRQASFDDANGDRGFVTFLAARSGETLVVLSVYGTEEEVPPAAVEQVLDTFEVTGG